MKLIGMLDSPFVRRTAISLYSLGLKFEHQALSVFRDYEEFQSLNPLVKAPTLLLNTGETLVDSSLIIQYAERVNEASLYSEDNSKFTLEQQIIGAASIANEKTVQLYYEFSLRPEDKQHAPWIERVQEQLNETYAVIEAILKKHPEMFETSQLNHASIAVAVAWLFTQKMRPNDVNAGNFPAVEAWSNSAETTDAFKAYPFTP
jgi:glutathione S-transferase